MNLMKQKGSAGTKKMEKNKSITLLDNGTVSQMRQNEVDLFKGAMS